MARIPQNNNYKDDKDMPFPIVNSTKRAAIYARVSTQEQTKGDYPSCESQIEELVSYCGSRGWQVIKAIRDEGFNAGSLKRPGLSELRIWLD
jgi:DNA invertase Pin-like site-specific DNA recombinase